MLSNGISTVLGACLLALCTSANIGIKDDFRYISFQDLQSSITTFSSEGNSSFSQMLFDVSRNQIFVGARDGLYRLSLSKLRYLEYAKWQSSMDKRTSCVSKGQSEENCHNYIKILLSTGRQIFACGTNAFSPQCSWREIDNISNVTQLIDGIAKSPHNPTANITAFLSENGEYYFAGPTDFSGSDSLISKSVGNVTLRTKQYNSYWLNEPQFVGSFESEKFVYFLFREAAVEYMNCGKSIYSRIARVCKNDQGGGLSIFKNNWTTFIKARLNCSVNGDYPFYFNEIQSMSYVSTVHTVYATFTTSANSITGSAICAFNLTAIDEAFNGPFKYQQNMDSAWVKHDNPYVDHYNCKASSKDNYLLFTSNYHLMDSAVQATTLNPLHVSSLERLTHITVDVLQTKQTIVHVLYVATTDGLIKKFSLLPPYQKTCVIEIWQPVPDTNIPIRNMQFLKDTNSLYITTTQGLAEISSSHCKRHTSKDNCKNSMDPYCGWNERDESCSPAPDGDPHNRFWKQHLNTCPVLSTPIDGGWSSWSEWAPCHHKISSESDDVDQCLCQTRECNNPSSVNGGKQCVGSKVAVANCTVHGGWSDWSAWSACSATCGTAIKTRFRTCTNPSPAYGGRVCVGQGRSEVFCVEYPPCPAQPIDGGWGPWSPWSSCTVNCGGGYRIRQRKCDNPTPYNGGQHCKGNDIEYERCKEEPCNEKKNTHTTEWVVTHMDEETKMYHKRRYKITCRAPVKYPNQVKISVKDEFQNCQNSQCISEDTDFNDWSAWSSWTECSVSCGGGVQTRTRYCRNRSKNYCAGESIQTRDCNVNNCESTWGCWSEWSPCNVSCGWGVKTRIRNCLRYTCTGPSREQQPCEDQPCEGILGWGNWTEWSLCDENNEQHRKRKCFHENPGSRMCQGKEFETRLCLPEDPNEIGIMGQQLEQNSCISMGFSFFFIGVIVGLMPSLIYLSYYLVRKKKDAIPCSPHYMTTEQNPYISVPTREKVTKKHSSASSGMYPTNGTIKSIKCYEDDYVPKINLKRNSHDAKNGHSKPYECDKFLYD